MLTYMKLEKMAGIRKTYDFTNPKVMSSAELILPFNSALLWYHKEYLENKLFRNLPNKPKVLVYDKYFEKLEGKYTKKNISKSSIIGNLKRFDKDKVFEFVPSPSKLYLTRKDTLIMFDFTYLKEVYTYKKYSNSKYDITLNMLRTLISASKEPDRITNRSIYFPIPVPKYIPTLKEIDKALKLKNYKVLSIVKDERMLLVLELIRMITNKESIFDRLINKNTSDLKFMFGLNGNVTFCSMQNLLALNSDNDIEEATVKGVNGSEVIKTLLKFLIYLTISEPKPLKELEKESSTDVKISKGSIEVDVDVLIEEHNKRQEEIVVDTQNIKIEQTLDDIKSKEVNPHDVGKDLLEEKLEEGLISKGHYEKGMSLLEEHKENSSKNDLLESDFKLEIEEYPDNETILDKEMLKNTVDVFSNQYLKKIYKKHQNKVFLQPSVEGHILKEHIIESTDNAAYSTEKHSVTYLAANGRESKITMIIPKISSNGIFKLNNNEYILRKQKAELPIVKIDYNKVALTSYRNKIFIEKSHKSQTDLGLAIYKKMKVMLDDTESGLSMLIFGKSVTADKIDSHIYNIFSRSIKGFKYNNISFSFDYKNRKSKFNIDEEHMYGIIVAMKGKTSYYINKENELISVSDKETNLGDFLTYLNIVVGELPIEFAVMQIMGEKIPLVLILIFYYGLENLLELTNATYRKEPATGKLEILDSEYIIRFSDHRFVVTRGWHDIIISGLAHIKNLKYNESKSMNFDTGINDIFNDLGYNSRRLSIELNSLKHMWVDPMTKDILIQMKEPTTFEGLLFRAAELLIDDNYTNQNDVNGLVIRGHERINGMVYHIIAKAMKENAYKQGIAKTKITINPYELLSMLAEDGTFTLLDDLNPFSRMKQNEDVAMIGKFGRSKAGLSTKDRVFDKSAIGILSEASKDSGQVGETGYLSASPKISNSLGMLVESMDKLTGSNMFSSSMNFHAGSDTDDGKRALYISVQNGSVVATNSQTVWPIGTGYEYIIPYRMDKKYVTYAIAEGKVLKVSRDTVVILYKDKKKTYKLKDWTSKEVGGLAYKHSLTTQLSEGDKVKKWDIIYYDISFFGPDVFDRKRIIYKGGDTALVALDETEEVYEDSCAISSKFSEEFSTNVTKVNSRTLPHTSNISMIASIGKKISFNDTIISFTDSIMIDEPLLNPKSQSIIDELNNNAFKAGAKGEFFNFVIYYNFELEDAHKTVQEIIKESDKRLLSSTGHTGRVDNTYSIKGKPLLEGDFEIKFFIEKVDEMSVGDKLIVANQLKATIGDIFEEIVTESGDKITMKISYRSVGARIVNSPEDIGSSMIVLRQLNKETEALYKL